MRLNSTLLAYGSPDAMVFGHTIYWHSSSFDACDLTDMELLMHELVHMRQYENDGQHVFACAYGAGVLYHRDHDLIPYEEEAIAFTRRNKKAMYSLMKVQPLCSEKIDFFSRNLTRSDDWDWLVWG